MLTSQQAAELLERQPQLQELVVAGKVHEVRTTSGGLRICKDSLIS